MIPALLLMLADAPAPAASAKPSPRPSAKAYTEDDLKRVRKRDDLIATPGGQGYRPDMVAPSPSPSGFPPSPTPEAQWRGRGDAARRAIVDAEKKVVDLQAELDGLRNDRGAADTMDPNREQTRQAKIAAAATGIEQARAAVTTAKKALSDLEDEARRANVPPGWVRER